MNLFEAKTTRAYICSRIHALPKKGRGEAGRIASALGISTTLVSHVLSGQRLLTSEQAEKLSEYWGLPALEVDYFLTLNQLERAGTSGLKKYWQTKLDALRVDSRVIAKRLRPDRVLNDQERSIFYSSPIYSAVRLFTSTSRQGKTNDEIAIRFEISRAKASKVTSFLKSVGLLKEERGRFQMGVQSTHLESSSPHLLRHHANWRIKAVQYSDDIGEDELMFTSPVSLSKQSFDQLREKMVIFIKEFLCEIKDSPEEEIACFNMDFFWIRK